MTDPGGPPPPPQPPTGGPPPPPGAPPPPPGGGGNVYNRKLDAQGRPLAEWWKRVAAFIIDQVILAIPAWIIMGILGVGFSSTAEIDPNTGQITGGGGFFGAMIGVGLVFLVIGILYFVILNGNERGQTVGKMVLKIQVRDEATGGPIGYGKAAIRYLVAWVMWAACYIPGIVDALFPLWDDKRQTIHDKAAQSLVIEVT